MKPLLASLSLVCVLAGPALAEKAKPSEAETSARAYLAAAVAGTATATVSKDKPLSHWSDTPVASCTTGKATTPEALRAVHTCLKDQTKSIAVDGEPQAVTIADVTKRFDKKLRAAMTTAAKGTKIIEFVYNGDGETALIDFAIAPDKSVKAIWVSAEAVE